MAISTALAETWSATEFGNADLNRYARMKLRDDTRRGLQFMAALSLGMQFAIMVLILVHGLGMPGP